MEVSGAGVTFRGPEAPEGDVRPGLGCRPALGRRTMADPTALPLPVAAPAPDLGRRLLFAGFVFLFAVATLSGQLRRELLTVDDFREMEVAREMEADGSVLVPHLAGLPFVEKPPGFAAVLAATFRLVGGTSLPAARLVCAGFALVFVAGTYGLGRAASGFPGGLLAAAFLSFSPLYLCTSHTVLLDNALGATTAFALYFAWTALAAEREADQVRRFAAAAGALGISFLLKGFVGPAIFTSGALLHAAWTGRRAEWRLLLRPLPVLAFLLPVSLWLVPFVTRAPGSLVYEFFILNHVGRFAQAYDSHPRPAYFYLMTLGYLFAPGVLFLPAGFRAAWRERRDPGGRAAAFGLAFSVGPLVLLSLSRAKDSVYFLPAYPALALAASEGLLRIVRARMSEGPRRVPRAFMIAGVSAAILWTVAVGLYYAGPFHEWELRRKPWRASLAECLPATAGRPLFLLAPDDVLRGAFGIAQGRTAIEVGAPAELLERLDGEPHAAGVVKCGLPGPPAQLLEGAAARGLELMEEKRLPYRQGTMLLVLSLRRRTGGEGAR